MSRTLDSIIKRTGKALIIGSLVLSPYSSRGAGVEVEIKSYSQNVDLNDSSPDENIYVRGKKNELAAQGGTVVVNEYEIILKYKNKDGKEVKEILETLDRSVEELYLDGKNIHYVLKYNNDEIKKDEANEQIKSDKKKKRYSKHHINHLSNLSYGSAVRDYYSEEYPKKIKDKKTVE